MFPWALIRCRKEKVSFLLAARAPWGPREAGGPAPLPPCPARAAVWTGPWRAGSCCPRGGGSTSSPSAPPPSTTGLSPRAAPARPSGWARGRGGGSGAGPGGRALTASPVPVDGGGGLRAHPQREQPRRGAVLLLPQGAGGLGAGRRPAVSTGGSLGLCLGPEQPLVATESGCVWLLGSCCLLFYFLFLFASFQGGAQKTHRGLCFSFSSERTS